MSGEPDLSLQEQAELLACRWEMLASAMPPRMVIPTHAIIPLMPALLRAGMPLTPDLLAGQRTIIAGLEALAAAHRVQGKRGKR